MANDNNLPAPESRSEELLNRIVQNTAGNGADTPLPDPQSREEQYLAKIAENTAGGGGGGGGADVLWVHLTTEDYETWQADKTFAQIYAAAEAGTIVKAIVDYVGDKTVCDLVYYSEEGTIIFSSFQAWYGDDDTRYASACGVYIYADDTPSVVVKHNTFELTDDD